MPEACTTNDSLLGSQSQGFSGWWTRGYGVPPLLRTDMWAVSHFIKQGIDL